MQQKFKGYAEQLVRDYGLRKDTKTAKNIITAGSWMDDNYDLIDQIEEGPDMGEAVCKACGHRDVVGESITEFHVTRKGKAIDPVYLCDTCVDNVCKIVNKARRK